jgi:hypothetical protein
VRSQNCVQMTLRRSEWTQNRKSLRRCSRLYAECTQNQPDSTQNTDYTQRLNQRIGQLASLTQKHSDGTPHDSALFKMYSESTRIHKNPLRMPLILAKPTECAQNARKDTQQSECTQNVPGISQKHPECTRNHSEGTNILGNALECTQKAHTATRNHSG